MTNVCNLEEVSPSVEIHSITLESVATSETLISVRLSAQEIITGEETARWYKDSEYSKHLRIRVIYSFSEEQSEGLDYIKQRYDQYQDLTRPVLIGRGQGLDFAIPPGKNSITSTLEDFIQHTRNELSRTRVGDQVLPNLEYLMRNANPAPLETANIQRIQGQEQGFAKNGTGAYDGISYQDYLLSDLISKTPGGEFRTELSPVSSGQETYLKETVPLNPVKIRTAPGDSGLDHLTRWEGGHLSVYAFIYLDERSFYESLQLPAPEQSQVPLTRGAGKISCATVIGNYTAYEPIEIQETVLPNASIKRTTNNLLQGRLTNPATEPNIFPFTKIPNPEASVLSDVRVRQEFEESVNNLEYYDLYGRTDDELINSVDFDFVSKNNSFSDFWASKDFDENIRYMLICDQKNYLMNNSQFPFLYSMDSIAEDLFRGRLFLRDVESRTILWSLDLGVPPAGVVSIEMKRRRSSFIAGGIENNLPTQNHRNRIKPTGDFVEKTIKPPMVLSDEKANMLHRSALLSKFVKIYEGIDSVDREDEYNFSLRDQSETPAKFQYGAKLTIHDCASTYLKTVADILDECETSIRQLHKYLISAPPADYSDSSWVNRQTPRDITGLYNYETGAIKTSVINLNEVLYENDQSIAAFVRYWVATYVSLLEKFDVSVRQDLSYSDYQINILGFLRVQENLDNMVADVDADAFLVLADLMGKFSYSIRSKISSIFEQSFYDPMESLVKPTISQATSGEGNLILLTEEKYFPETIDYGLQDRFGYSYLSDHQPITNDVGALTRVTTGNLLKRSKQEFSKYFAPRSVTGDQLRNAYNDSSPSFKAASYKYFTPNVIKRPGQQDINQLSYINTDGKEMEYPLDLYSQLFLDIINNKKKSKYENNNFLSDIKYINYATPGNSVSNQLFESSVDTLTKDYACHIELCPTNCEPQFSLPSIKTGLKTSLTVAVRPGRLGSTEAGEAVYDGIMGGSTRINPDEETGNDAANEQNRLNVNNEKEDYSRTFLTNAAPPTKLTFAILGALELQSDDIRSAEDHLDLRSSPSYEARLFNSMRNIAMALGILPDDVVESVESGRLRDFPNQIKSMLIMAMQQQVAYIATGDDVVGFDARRIRLLDKVISPGNGGQNIRNVSFFDDNAENPPFSLVKDPMKVYAKFLTFWMNYKQLATIEYFDFAPLRAGRSLKYCSWRPMEGQDFNNAFTNKSSYLCRVRTATNEDLYRELGEQVRRDLLEKPDLFELPIYNEYFVLEFGNADRVVINGQEQEQEPPVPEEEQPQGEQGEEGEPEDEEVLQGLPNEEDIGLDENAGDCPPGQRRNPYTGQCEPVQGLGA